MSSLDIVRQLWEQAKLPSRVLEKTIRSGNVVLGHDPAEYGQAIRSSFQLTAVAQGCTAAIALANRFYEDLVDLEVEQNSKEEVVQIVLPQVSVDARHAIAEYRHWTRIHSPQSPGKASTKEMIDRAISSSSDEAKELLSIPKDAVAEWDPLAGLYRTSPSPSPTQRGVPAAVRIHTNFPHHKLGILQLLGLAPESARWNDPGIQEDVFSRVDRKEVQKKLDEWDAFEFEQAAQARGLCVTAYRSAEEWKASEMSKALAGWMGENGGSALRISRITANKDQKSGTRRDGKQLRVVDMSRVLAGPTSTRTLAAHGADVILLSSPHLPNLPLTELDTARGKRTAFVELPKGEEGLPTEMIMLIQGADVFSQAYRPGGLAERGLSAEDVQALRPGIVYAELCAFGFAGPWSKTRAYDSLTQTACGMNYLEGLSYREHHAGISKEGDEELVEPRPLPVQALDFAAGSLMCFATLACKCRAILDRLEGKTSEDEGEEGWKVQVSLASTAEWIQSFGQIHGDDAWTAPPEAAIPSDAEELAAMVGSYKVRGLKSEQDVDVLAIRHASIPAQEESDNEQRNGLRWTVPAHLGVDQLEW